MSSNKNFMFIDIDHLNFAGEAQKAFFEKPHDDLFRGSGKDNCAEAALAGELKAVRKALEQVDGMVFSFDEFHLIEFKTRKYAIAPFMCMPTGFGKSLIMEANRQQILADFKAGMEGLYEQERQERNVVTLDSLTSLLHDHSYQVLEPLPEPKKTQAQVWARDWRKKRK